MTCKIRGVSEPTIVLGAVVDPDETAAADIERVISKTASLREQVHSLAHPQCEIVLQRKCLDVSKVNYILRCNGDLVPDNML